MRPSPGSGAGSRNATGHGARLARLGRTQVRGGLLPVEEATALHGVGFEPVSEVIGAVASTVTPSGFYSSGYLPFQQQQYYNQPVRGRTRVDSAWTGQPSLNAWDPRTFTSSSGNRAVGTPTEITALRSGYQTALNRLVEEVRALGADGAVDIRLERTVTHLSGSQLWSFLAVGTAVRSRGRTRPARPFTTTLPGGQVAAAIRGGWVPVSVLSAPVMAIRYVDLESRIRRRRFAANGEIDAFTDVVNTCRHQARRDFASAARAACADGAVMSDMSLTFEAERNDPVCRATVTVTGTALARLPSRRVELSPLTIMPLNDRSRTGERHDRT